MWKMVCDKENGVCDKVLCERSCVCVWKLCVKDGVWQSGVWKMVCGKRTMCRVPRCRVEKSKHVTDSCDCTRQKVHCWIRKFRGTPISGTSSLGVTKNSEKSPFECPTCATKIGTQENGYGTISSFSCQVTVAYLRRIWFRSQGGMFAGFSALATGWE